MKKLFTIQNAGVRADFYALGEHRIRITGERSTPNYKLNVCWWRNSVWVFIFDSVYDYEYGKTSKEDIESWFEENICRAVQFIDGA